MMTMTLALTSVVDGEDNRCVCVNTYLRACHASSHTKVHKMTSTLSPFLLDINPC